jgi:hypothetical protein
MQDIRLFHKFIQDAYPHYPIGNDYVWTHDIPNLAHSVRCVAYLAVARIC